jgi:hypothetical protein
VTADHAQAAELIARAFALLTGAGGETRGWIPVDKNVPGGAHAVSPNRRVRILRRVVVAVKPRHPARSPRRYQVAPIRNAPPELGDSVA